MPFKLRFHEDHTTGLVAICDVCGQIAMGDDANILWRPSGDEKPGDCHPYVIACRDECTRVVDLKHGHQYSQNLDVALGYLLNNTQTDLERARHTMGLLAMIG